MPTPTKGPRLGGSPQHERQLLANLATALFEHGGITTTHAKAKRLRPLAERMVTFAKRGDLHARRQVLATVRDKDVVYKLFSEIGPGFAERPGGYTRITKVGPRKGDNAPMARIELVEAKTIAQEAVGEAEAARGTRFARRGAASTELPATAAAAEVPAEDETDAPVDAVADVGSGPVTLEPTAEADPVEAPAATDDGEQLADEVLTSTEPAAEAPAIETPPAEGES